MSVGRVRSPWPGRALRAAMAAALLALALRAATPDDGAGLLESLLRARSAALGESLVCGLAAVLCFGLNFVVGARRFEELLRGAGLGLTFGRVLRAYVVAAFFNTVLPGAVMGDVHRVLDARHGTGRGSAVFAIVVLERLLALAALGAIALLAFPFIPFAATGTQELRLPLLALASGCVLAPALVLRPAPATWLRRVIARASRGGAGLTRRADYALAALASLRARPRLLARGFALSLVCQLLPVLAVMALARPLTHPVAWYWFAVIVPFVTLMSMLPISFGGTGVRELLFVVLFGALGMPKATALALALATLLVTLFWAGVGLALFAAGRMSPGGLPQTGAP